MSALSVVWSARERLLRLQNVDEELMRKLEDAMKSTGQIELKEAYGLDDEVEVQCLLHSQKKLSLNKGDEKKHSSCEKASGSGQDPEEGEHSGPSFTGATEFLLNVNTPNEKCVGKMNQHINDIETILLNDHGSKFIWICGTGDGAGKTTLARKLFDKSEIVKAFDGRAWAPVGQKFQARAVATNVLLQLSYAAIDKKDMQPLATAEIMERLEEAQRGRRCLVVLDHVCTVEAWKTIQSALPLHKETRVIITSILEKEGLEKKISDKTIISIEPLDPDQTWEVLENQLSDEDKSIAKEEKWKDAIEELKTKVFKRCSGNPLAATILGGMMRGKMETFLSGEKGELSDWLNNPSSLPGGEPDKSLQELLLLCYKQLPYLLKSCFLYMGLFPDDRVIPVEKLYLIWIGEGVILEQEGETRMVTAEKYLKALAQRGLVLLQEEDTPNLLKVKSCKLHSQVRKICMLEGQKDGFIRLEKQTTAEGDKEKLSPTKRKVAIYKESPQSTVKKLHEEAKPVRALLCFKALFGKEMVEYLKDFELARLLDFDEVDFPSGVSLNSIQNLVHLRHLSFRECNVEAFPSSLKLFSVLETLDLLISSSGTPVTLPDNLGELSSLLHLYLPLSFKTSTGEKLKLDQLERLETLENFNAGKCIIDDLKLLKKLRIFKGIADGYNQDVAVMVKYVKETTDLSNSALSLKHFDINGIDKTNSVEMLLTTASLLALEIEGCVGEMPNIDKSFVGVNITKIVFNGTEFVTDPMLILGQFPHLRDLNLCDDAYLGPEMKCCNRSFPKLQNLEISNFWAWAKLNVEPGALPSLSRLVIKHCRKLKIGRSDLKKIPTLREIMIDVEICD